MELDPQIIEKLSSRGILAYVAVTLAGDVEATTTVLAMLVKVQTAVMLEGLKEFAGEAPSLLKQPKKGKWICGNGGDALTLQNLDLRREFFIDDLKKYWDCLNDVTPPFSMGAKDGAAIRRLLQDNPKWDATIWRQALNNRAVSVIRHSAGSRSEPLFMWIGKLSSYVGGPIDKYGKPVGNGKAVDNEHNNRSAVESYLNGHAGTRT